jgi:hypothetical protein
MVGLASAPAARLVGAGFGYLLIAYSDLSTYRVAAFGAAGALVARAVSRLLQSNRFSPGTNLSV